MGRSSAGPELTVAAALGAAAATPEPQEAAADELGGAGATAGCASGGADAHATTAAATPTAATPGSASASVLTAAELLTAAEHSNAQAARPGNPFTRGHP